MFMKKYARLFTTAVTAAVLALSAVPAAAESSVPQEITDALKGTFVADEPIKTIRGFADVFKGDQLQFDADVNLGEEGSGKVSAAFDKKSLNHSITGTISAGGVNIDFQESMDDTRLAIACPVILQTPVSYDFTNDSPTGALEQYSSYISMANQVIRTLRENASSGSLGAKVSDSYTEAVLNKLNELTFTAIDGKDCTAGSATVACSGWQTTVSGEWLADLADTALNTPMQDNGLSCLDSLRQTGALISSLGGDYDISDIEQLPDQLRTIGEITLDCYCGDGVVREVDITAEGTAAIKLTGETVPWHNIVVETGDVTIPFLTTTEEGTKTTYSTISEGSAMAVSYDTASGEYSVQMDDIPVISGTFGRSDSGIVFSGAAEGVDFSFNVSDKAEIKPIEGETIELTTATEEQMQSLMEIINALSGAAGGAASPAA